MCHICTVLAVVPGVSVCLLPPFFWCSCVIFCVFLLCCLCGVEFPGFWLVCGFVLCGVGLLGVASCVVCVLFLLVGCLVVWLCPRFCSVVASGCWCVFVCCCVSVCVGSGVFWVVRCFVVLLVAVRLLVGCGGCVALSAFLLLCVAPSCHASGCCSFGGRSSGVALSAVLSRSGLFFFLTFFATAVLRWPVCGLCCSGLVVPLLVVSGSVFSSSVFVVSFFHQFCCFSWCSCFLLFGVVVESVCVPLDVSTCFFFRPFWFFSCGCSVVVLCGFHLVVCWFSVLHRCSFLVSHVVVGL